MAVLVAWLYFQTPLAITLKASLRGRGGLLPHHDHGRRLPAAGLHHGRDRRHCRVVALIKTIAPKDQVVQIMIVNVGFGTLLAALGATPVSILPPIMLALGYSSFVAIALPALGYDALCTYALLGVPVVVFAALVGKPVNEVGAYFRPLSCRSFSTCIALGMFWIVGTWKMVWRGIDFPALLSGLTAGLSPSG